MYGLTPWSAEERLAEVHAAEEWARVAAEDRKHDQVVWQREERIEVANRQALLEDDGLDRYDPADLRQLGIEEDDRRNFAAYADQGVTY